MDLNIKSDTVDKAIEIIEDSTKETRNALDQKTSRGINKLFDLLKSTPIGIKAEVYIQERPYKLKLAMDEMKKKYENIPQVNRTEPSSYIALKGVNELNYCLDEDYLKEMFENLLVSDMDTRKQGRVLPAYIEIIKQLSNNDAKFLKTLNDLRKLKFSNFPILKIIYVDSNKNPIYNENDLILIDISTENVTQIPAIVIENLLRLNIIEISFSNYLPNNSIYANAFHKLVENKKDLFDFKKGMLNITNYGLNFIDICLS